MYPSALLVLLLWQIFTEWFAKRRLISLLASGDFPRCASGCWYVLQQSSSPQPWCCAAQSAPFPWPRPNPSSSAVSWLSGLSACQALWENVLQIMTMQKTCQEPDSAHMWSRVPICNSRARQWALKHIDPILSARDLSPVPWADHAAAEQPLSKI